MRNKDFVSDQMFGGLRFKVLTIVDNGSEFISKALDYWTFENIVTLERSRLGKPMNTT